MPITVHSNLSLFAVPAAYFLAFAPHTARVIYLAQNPRVGFSNLNPRKTLEVEAKDAETKKLAAISDRLKSIHTNGLEIFPLFLSAIIIGNFARLPAKTMNIFAGAFVGSRVIYNAIYFLQSTELHGHARSAAFFVGQLSSLVVLFQSAMKVFSLDAY